MVSEFAPRLADDLATIGDAMQEGGDEGDGVGLDPGGCGGLCAGEEAGVWGVDERQRVFDPGPPRPAGEPRDGSISTPCHTRVTAPPLDVIVPGQRGCRN